MAIKTLGSAQKIRVGRESGNTTFISLGLMLIKENAHYIILYVQLVMVYW